jgi:hypothetical protein
MRTALLALAILPLTACATYSDELSRGQTAFEQNQHERALAVFRALENDESHLSPEEQTRYAYLRGMTDYRIGYKADARHWLIVAKAREGQTPNSLPADWKTTMNDRIKELNEEVFGGGVESLANVKKAGKSTDEPPPKKSTEEP